MKMSALSLCNKGISKYQTARVDDKEARKQFVLKCFTEKPKGTSDTPFYSLVGSAARSEVEV